MQDIELPEVVFFLVERVLRRAKEMTKDLFKEHGFEVTVDQWILLKRVNEEQGTTQVEIAQSTFKDPAAVTRILDILCRKGLVERQPRLEDRRAFEIRLTPQGQDLVHAMIPVVQEMRALSLEGFSETETNELKRLINKIYDNLLV